MKFLSYTLLFLLILAGHAANAQEDTLQQFVDKNSRMIDSLKLKVKDIVISGNEITKDHIILREMQLKRGGTFSLKKYKDDLLDIYNLGLFTKVDILPVPADNKQILLNVDVQERWYIWPLPSAGVEDGEYWKKFWLSLNLRWANFRGRNETANLRFRVFYNPSVSFSYSIPWIGEKLHLFTEFSIGYSKNRNQSLIAIGRSSEGTTIDFSEQSFDYYRFNTSLTVGKYVSKKLAFFVELGYNYLRVSDYQPDRTESPTGKDKYLTTTFGAQYDSRNIREFATKGYYLNTTYSRYGYLDHELNFGRFAIESHSFIPFKIKDSYSITLASRIYTNLAIGPDVPVYNHEFFGYGEQYVRGWRGIAFEGEDVISSFNEIRIPIIQPHYINAQNLPIVKIVPILKHMELRHGLYVTLIYDIGTIFNNNEVIFKKRFISGAGIGLDFIAPFGYVLRADWTARLGKPTVGQIALSLNAKF